jgi:hypothetical protein
MSIKEIISAIELKHRDYGITINPPASQKTIQEFEIRRKFELPGDFKEFYGSCNGFGCTDDLFNITPLNEVSDYGKDWYGFSEYMIYSDMWCVRIKPDKAYEIFIRWEFEIILTNSLNEFLSRFLNGGVFDKDGLYDWEEEKKKLQLPR